MTSAACQSNTSPLELARNLILKTLGVKRVSAWCEVSEAAVYQWLSRGTDTAPIPAAYVPKIATGAQDEGKPFDLRILLPGLPITTVLSPAEAVTPFSARR